MAIIVAPLCGPLCSAGVCASTESQSATCHERGPLANGVAQESSLSATKACNLSSLPAVRSNQRTGRLKRHREGSAAVADGSALSEVVIGTVGPLLSLSATDSPPRVQSNRAPTVLRI